MRSIRKDLRAARYAAAAMRPQRVLINALSLSQGGGSQSYLANLLRELDRDARGFHFTVLTDEANRASLHAGAIELAVVSLPPIGHPARVLARVAYEELLLPRRARRFDLLYCPADLSPAVATIPTVIALRNMHIYDHRFENTLRIHVLERLVRLGVRRARRVLFPSRAAADKIMQRLKLSADRVAVVHHGVSPESFELNRAHATRASDQKPYVFVPASVERHKRIEVLIQSLVHVADPTLEAWIAGTYEIDPDYTAELRALADRLGVAARVRFLGRVPYRQILDYYHGAVALAFTSILETFGQPMLEAMLAETPIAAADIPSFREIAGDIALYFPPDDALALARVVDRLVCDRDATAARVARGRARAAEFSWQRSVDSLCAVFESAFSEGGRGARK
jgi:glycosyltransferase involved in cell wall biosynthesis